MSRPTWLWLILLLLLWPAGAWAKPPAGIKVEIAYGYNNWLQLARVNPVIVDLDNASTDINLSGELVVEYNGDEYPARLELPTPSHKRFYFYIQLDSYQMQEITVRIRTKRYTDEFKINEYQRLRRPEDMNVVVLTRQKGSLGVVNQLPLVRLYRDLYAYYNSNLGSAVANVSYFDLDEIEANPKFFAAADAIVLADIDYRQATPELARTLEDCACAGKSVVFSLGANAPGVAASPLATLCPLASASTVQVGDRGSFGRRYGITAGDAPAVFAIGQPRPGAEVAAWAGTYPAVVRHNLGSGIVTAFAFDVTAAPFKQNPALARIFLDNVLRITESVAIANWFIHPVRSGKIIEGLAEARPMSPGFVLLFLAAYIALLGPLNFLILTRLKRRTLVWATIPLLIAAFAVIGYSTGYAYRGNENICAYFEEAHLYPGTAAVPYQDVMLVFTAARTKYKLELPDATAVLLPQLPSTGGDSPGAISSRILSTAQVGNTANPWLTKLQAQWISSTYAGQGYAELPGAVEAQVRADMGANGVRSLEGSFKLNLPFDLQRCYLFGFGIDRSLGDIAGQGEYDLLELQQRASPAPSAQGSYLVNSIPQFAQLQQESSYASLDYRNEVLLVGFTDQPIVPASVDFAHRTYQLTMVVIHLPYTPVVSLAGEPVVIKTALVGGTGFQVEQANSSYPIAEMQYVPQSMVFQMPANSYLEIAYDLGGDFTQAAYAHIRLDATPLKSKDQIKDVNDIVEVRAWDGAQWAAIRLPLAAKSFDLAYAPYVQAGGRMTLRFMAKTDFRLNLPQIMSFLT